MLLTAVWALTLVMAPLNVAPAASSSMHNQQASKAKKCKRDTNKRKCGKHGKCKRAPRKCIRQCAVKVADGSWIVIACSAKCKERILLSEPPRRLVVCNGVIVDNEVIYPEPPYYPEPHPDPVCAFEANGCNPEPHPDPVCAFKESECEPEPVTEPLEAKNPEIFLVASPKGGGLTPVACVEVVAPPFHPIGVLFVADKGDFGEARGSGKAAPQQVCAEYIPPGKKAKDEQDVFYVLLLDRDTGKFVKSERVAFTLEDLKIFYPSEGGAG